MNPSVPIEIDELRVGMYIQLPLSWMHHPFPTSNFRITSAEQIRVLRELGLRSLSYVPSKSSLLVDADEQLEAPVPDSLPPNAARPPQDGHTAQTAPREPVQPLRDCLARYREASAAYGEVAMNVARQPVVARECAEDLVAACVAELPEKDSCVIRLLADCHAGSSAAHAVNVMVLTLLLGQALSLRGKELQDLGLAGLLHDIGKTSMPLHIAEPGARLVAAELQRYRAHVGESVALGQRMGLPSDILIAIAQHHELADGSGYPLRLMGDDLSRNGQILALVNTYDRLCNPLQGSPALTPHEAVSHLYSQQRACFDGTILAAFIRLMGVYPPGSLVQLVDGRYALVTSVNADHPLRPTVMVHAASAAGSAARLLDLSRDRLLGIRRSLRPAQLPRAVLDTLLPDSRICYYFERATSVADQDGQA